MTESRDNINNKNFGNDDSSFMPTPEKFQAEQDALKKVHDPKDFSELQPKNDYEDLEESLKEKQQKDKRVINVNHDDKAVKKAIPSEKIQQKLEDNIDQPEQQKQKEIVQDQITNEQDNAEFISSDEIVLDQPKKEQKTSETQPQKPEIQQPQKPVSSEPVMKGSYTPKPEQKLKPKPKTPKKKVRLVKTLNEDESMFCGLCHLCNVLVVTAIWVPFFLYLTRSENEKVAFHSIQSIIYGAAIILIMVIYGALSSLISGTCGCMVLLTVPFLFLLCLTFWICAIYFSIETFRGFDYKIPYFSIAAEKIVEFLSFED